MKSTIKLDLLQSVVIHPTADGKVCMALTVGSVPMTTKFITPEQAAAIVAGLEFALDELAPSERRDARQCNGNCNQGRNCTCGVPA